MVTFFRRLGLKQYVEAVKKYGIDGRTLLVFEMEDFLTLGITHTIHVKKILLALEEIYPSRTRDLAGAAFLVRRDKIRKHGLYEEACTHIQRAYRGHLARRRTENLKLVTRLLIEESKMKAAVAATSVWWTDRLSEVKESKASERGKTFGRFSDHLTVRGWGHFEDGEWVPGKGSEHDGNPTRAITEWLNKNGYNDRRLRQFNEDREVFRDEKKSHK